MPRYMTHARSREELRQAFLSDIQHRLDTLDATLRQMKPNAAEASRITRARMELLSLYDYWREVEIRDSANLKEPQNG